MKVKDRYSSKTEEGKITISEDCLALCNMIEQLINKLEQTRVS